MLRDCPICDAHDGRFLKNYTKHHLARCRRCGMVYAGKRPTPAELAEFYATYPLHAQLNPITRARYLELLTDLAPARTHGRILDAGCGVGFFLDTAREAGWDTHGSEYDERVVKTCRDRGITMWQGALTNESFPDAYFDVITSFEVMEHLQDPLAELRNFHRMLRPGGVLYITTPNFSALSRRLIGQNWSVVNYPEHLNYFTPATLRRALESAGLSVTACRTTGISVSRLSYRVDSSDQREANHTPMNTDQRLRARIEGNGLLRVGKSSLNALLGMLSAGDTIKMFGARPQ